MPGAIPSITSGVRVPGICYTKQVVYLPTLGPFVLEVTRRTCLPGESAGSFNVIAGTASPVTPFQSAPPRF